MVSLPHNTVLCKKPISSSLPRSLSLHFFPALLFSFFSTLLICDSLISLLFRNTGRIHTAGFGFPTTISHFECSVSFTLPAQARSLMFFTQLKFQGQCSLRVLNGNFCSIQSWKWPSALLCCCAVVRDLLQALGAALQKNRLNFIQSPQMFGSEDQYAPTHSEPSVHKAYKNIQRVLQEDFSPKRH